MIKNLNVVDVSELTIPDDIDVEKLDVVKIENAPKVCGTCRYCNAVVYRVTPDGMYFSSNGEIICRRYPPTDSGFPGVSPETWCGEYSPVTQNEINQIAIIEYAAKNQMS